MSKIAYLLQGKSHLEEGNGNTYYCGRVEFTQKIELISDATLNSSFYTLEALHNKAIEVFREVCVPKGAVLLVENMLYSSDPGKVFATIPGKESIMKELNIFRREYFKAVVTRDNGYGNEMRKRYINLLTQVNKGLK